MSDEDGPAAAAIVVVVDDVVEVLDVLDVELVVVARCVVVVLRCVVVVWGACVVVGAIVVVVGAAVVVVEAVVVVVDEGSGSTAPAVPRPKPNVPSINTSAAMPSATIEARRGEHGRITSLTLDPRCASPESVSSDAADRNRWCDHR